MSRSHHVSISEICIEISTCLPVKITCRIKFGVHGFIQHYVMKSMNEECIMLIISAILQSS